MTKNCAVCGHGPGIRSFPANSLAYKQNMWIDRLNLLPDESARLLRESRQKLADGQRIYWCEKHFGTTHPDPVDRRFVATYTQPSATIVRFRPANTIGYERRTCIVCGEKQNQKEMHKFTIVESKRRLWIAALRSTPEGRRELSAQISASKSAPHLCSAHFAPSDYIRSANAVILKPDAVPHYDDQPLVKVEPQPTPPQAVPKEELEARRVQAHKPRIIINSNPYPVPLRQDKDDGRHSSLFQYGRRTCIVCGEKRNRKEVHQFTAVDAKRRAWIDAVRSTNEGRRALAAQLSEAPRPHLCAAHFAPSDYIRSATAVVLRPDAVPRYDDRPRVRVAPQPTAVPKEEELEASRVEGQEPGTVVKDEPLDEEPDIKMEEADCDPSSNGYNLMVQIHHPVIAELGVPSTSTAAEIKQEEPTDENPGDREIKQEDDAQDPIVNQGYQQPSSSGTNSNLAFLLSREIHLNWLECPICPKTGMTVNNFVAHLQVVHDTTPFKAKLAFQCACGLTETDANAAAMHKFACRQYSLSVVKRPI